MVLRHEVLNEAQNRLLFGGERFHVGPFLTGVFRVRSRLIDLERPF